jgi:osmotically-inducible protein OsmY
MRYIVAFLVLGSLQAWAQPPSDAVTRDQVSLKLTLDSDVRGNGIQVTVQNGSVTLRGTVRDEKARQKAAKLVKKVKGVKSVDNQLRLPEERN